MHLSVRPAAGKTTLISLAARFYDTTSGTVLIDGKVIKEYTFDALYDRIGYVTQKAVLFAGDIRDNVLFGESAAVPTDENAQKALELAQASEFVEKLPGKLDAPISQGRIQCFRRTEAAFGNRPCVGEKSPRF